MNKITTAIKPSTLTAFVLTGIAVFLFGITDQFSNDTTNTLHIIVGSIFVAGGIIFTIPQLRRHSHNFDLLMGGVIALWAAAELFVAQDYVVAPALGIAGVIFWNSTKKSD